MLESHCSATVISDNVSLVINGDVHVKAKQVTMCERSWKGRDDRDLASRLPSREGLHKPNEAASLSVLYLSKTRRTQSR